MQLGVTGYETFVTDSHTIFSGRDGHTVTGAAKYAPLIIAGKSNPAQFQHDLKVHQQGKTGYATFCIACANSGIEKWKVDMTQMTCAYYDKQGNEILVEIIPST